jgi:rhodanese-related sulfurtransferase
MGLQQNITTAMADSLIRATKNLVVLDVRTPEEYRLGHLSRAKLIDYYDPKFEDHLRVLPKDATIVVYCRSGRRSADALAILTKLKYSRVYNMLGGIDAWKNEGREVVKGK